MMCTSDLLQRSYWLGSRLTFVMLMLGVAACTTEDAADARLWMQSQKAVPTIREFQKPTVFVPQNYSADGLIDPFSKGKIKSQLPDIAEEIKVLSPLAEIAMAEQKRVKEPLESYSLESISYVGNLKNTKNNIALLRVGNAVIQAKVGQRLGKNFGKITEITDSTVQIHELVPSGEDWNERVSVLELPQSTGNN